MWTCGNGHEQDDTDEHCRTCGQPRPQPQDVAGVAGADGLPPPPAGAAVDPQPPGHSGKARKAAPVGALLVGALAGYLIAAQAQPSPQEQLEQLASRLCASLGGEMRIVGAGMVGLAVDQAEDLGFAGHELGAEVRSICPVTYSDAISQ